MRTRTDLTLAVRSTLVTLSAASLATAPRVTVAQPGRRGPLPWPPGASAAPRQVADAVVRAAVVRFYPAALRGGLGRRPVVWILADGHNRVLRTAVGSDGLQPASGGGARLDWAAAAAKLPGMPASARPGDLLQWGHLGAGARTVDVIWVRVFLGLRDASSAGALTAA